MTRLVVLMGSGETAPTMRAVHRRVFERLDGDPSAVLLDTPFGFQENAAILIEKAVEYFADATGRTVVAAGLPRADLDDVVAHERAIARVRDADWLFAGPGSPTYALRQWTSTAVPAILTERLRREGAIVFASAAALTLGTVTLPVYEIYKAGEPPCWLDGLGILDEIGLDVAVIPHFDNREGGNHDTRYCYLGERRLAMLERQLPDGTFVLGVDEHTAVVFDLDADTATVEGKGALTLRRDGASVRIESGETVPLELVRRAGAGRPSERASPASSPAGPAVASAAADATPVSLGEAARSLQAAFDGALAAGDADGAVAAILDLETEIVAWSRDTLQSDDLDRARGALRAMVVRLGEAAASGLRDPREVVGPLVDVALAARVVARKQRAFAVADAIRDGLVGAGIEVRDTSDGTEWLVSS